jgi:hypothetical protein
VSNHSPTVEATGCPHNAGVQQISFDGKTKDGVRMRVTATIVQVDEF